MNYFFKKLFDICMFCFIFVSRQILWILNLKKKFMTFVWNKKKTD